ncbi:MAG: hypothetical protein ACR2QC_06540 [Gammaproteobacteria bacterium]
MYGEYFVVDGGYFAVDGGYFAADGKYFAADGKFSAILWFNANVLFSSHAPKGEKTMILSQKYADHSAELLTIVDYVLAGDGSPTQRATELGMTGEEVGDISALRVAYETAYTAYTNPNTHNAITVHQMRVADDNAYTVILPLRQRLKNGTAELTPEDYANLGIHEDKKTRTPSEIPTDVPTAILVESRPMALTFEATEQSTDGVNRVILPRYCRVAREIAVMAQGAEPADGDYHSLDNAGRSRFTIMFAAAQVGMNVYLRIAYENSAGRGPFSLPVKAIII